jgi:hypothetical protein
MCRLTVGCKEDACEVLRQIFAGEATHRSYAHLRGTKVWVAIAQAIEYLPSQGSTKDGSVTVIQNANAIDIY